MCIMGGLLQIFIKKVLRFEHFLHGMNELLRGGKRAWKVNKGKVVGSCE